MFLSGVELEGYLIGQIQEETIPKKKKLLWRFVTGQNLNLSLGIIESALKGKIGALELQCVTNLRFSQLEKRKRGSTFEDRADAVYKGQ